MCRFLVPDTGSALEKISGMRFTDMTDRSSLTKRTLHSSLLLGALIILAAVSIVTWGYIETPCQLVSMRPHILGPAINNLEVKITSPKHCSLNIPINKETPIEGSYAGDMNGRKIWVLVYASSNQKYYPKIVELTSPGRWSSVLFDSNVEQLDIVATVTDEDSEADRRFLEWFKQGEFLGFSHCDLPDGLTEMDVITVKTE